MSITSYKGELMENIITSKDNSNIVITSYSIHYTKLYDSREGRFISPVAEDVGYEIYNKSDGEHIV